MSTKYVIKQDNKIELDKCKFVKAYMESLKESMQIVLEIIL